MLLIHKQLNGAERGTRSRRSSGINCRALAPEAFSPGFTVTPEAALTGIAAMLRLYVARSLEDAGLPLALRLGASGNAGMVEILLGILTTHLAFVATNWAFHNNFGPGRRRSVHVGWGHTFQATRFDGLPQGESTSAEIFTRFSRVRGQRPA
jgi:hypothetical protein